MGNMFAYQEKTGMSPNQILNMPYIQYVIGSLTAPSIDYDDKSKNNKSDVPPKGFGTKISELTDSERKLIKKV